MNCTGKNSYFYYLHIYTIYMFYHYIWIMMNTPCTINVLGVIIYPYFFKNKIWRAKKTFMSKMLFIKHQDPGSSIQWCMLIIYTVHNGKNNRRASRKLENLLLKNLIVFDERKGVFVMYSKNKISFRWIRSDNICSTCHVHLQTKFHLNILCCRNKVQYKFCFLSLKRWFIFLGSM